MKKGFASFFMITAALLSVNAFAEDTASVIIDGNEIIYDQRPIIENGRVLVPMRATFEALGAEIQWDNAEKTVRADNGSSNITIKVGDTEMKIDGRESVELDVPAKIVNERTLVPLRAVSEAFNAEVAWDSNTKTVRITTVGAVDLAENSSEKKYDYYNEYKADDGTVIFNEGYSYEKLDESIDGSIKEKIYGVIEQECKKLMEDSTKDYGDGSNPVDFLKDVYEENFKGSDNKFMECSNEGFFEIKENGDKYISYYGGNYIYTGGAHGSGRAVCLTFDKKTGDRVTAADVLGISEEEVRTLKIDKYKEKIEKSPDWFFDDALNNLEDVIDQNSDFYIENGKVKFIITECYLLGPYASGYIEADGE